MAFCSCCSTKPPICSTWLRTFSRSSLKRREMWWVRSAVSIKNTFNCGEFVYIRLHRASTAHAIFVRSSARGLAHVLLPYPLLREVTGKGAALARRAWHVEPAAMPLQGVLDDRQAQPGAALAAGASRVHSIEALGQARNMFRRDADAAVDHRKVRSLAVDPPSHSHRPLGRRVFHAVHQHIGESGFEFVGGAE